VLLISITTMYNIEFNLNWTKKMTIVLLNDIVLVLTVQ